MVKKSVLALITHGSHKTASHRCHPDAFAQKLGFLFNRYKHEGGEYLYQLINYYDISANIIVSACFGISLWPTNTRNRNIYFDASSRLACPTRIVIWTYALRSKSAFLNHEPVGINVIWWPIIFVLHEVMTHLPVHIVQCWIVWHIYPNCFWPLFPLNLANTVVTYALLVTIHSFRS